MCMQFAIICSIVMFSIVLCSSVNRYYIYNCCSFLQADTLPPRVPGEGMTVNDYQGMDGSSTANNSIYMQLLEVSDIINKVQWPFL